MTEIYTVIYFTPQNCFKSFVENVTTTRREADLGAVTKIKADTAKLIGNSGFGSVIMDKTKHRKIDNVLGKSKAKKEVNKWNFLNLHELDHDVFEIEKLKSKIHLDLPITIGYFILQYAKLHMLKFYYDFLDVYIDRADFQKLQMDTDSCYLALAGENLEKVVKQSKKKKYLHMLYGNCNEDEYECDGATKWLPRRCCKTHALKDSRTPGLFKLEFSGDVFVGLCSKLYVVGNREKDITKHSSKGISKPAMKETCEQLNMSVVDVYLKVLNEGRNLSATNKGIRVFDSTVMSYSQERNGICYFYPKRVVQDDGITTEPLDLTLTP